MPLADTGLLTFADIRVWAKRWCCRWCRAKAERICEIDHEPWCRVLARTAPMEEAADG